MKHGVMPASTGGIDVSVGVFSTHSRRGNDISLTETQEEPLYVYSLIGVAGRRTEKYATPQHCIQGG